MNGEASANNPSEDALDEFRRVLGYPDLPVSDEEQETFPDLLRHEATIVEPSEDISAVADDPDDDVFLEIAVEASADYVVSGDPHLKELDEFRGIRIRSPADFLDADDSPALA